MRSKWSICILFVCFVLFFRGTALGQSELVRSIEFLDARVPTVTLREVKVEPWREDEKQIISNYFKVFIGQVPGLVQRATAYRPIRLYRMTQIGPENPLVLTKLDEHALYISDRFFRERSEAKGRDHSWGEWTMIHELTHLAEGGGISSGRAWVDIVKPLMDRVQDDLKRRGLSWAEAQKAGLHEIARKQGLPTLYASETTYEALAEYVAAIVLDKQVSPPPSVKTFIQTQMLSTPFVPMDSMRYRAQGLTLLEKGEVDKAIHAFDNAINADPNLGIAYYDRAAAWKRKKEWHKVISDFSQVVRLFPDEKGPLADAYFERGLAWGELGDLDRTLADLSEAIRLFPLNAEAYGRRGLIWEGKKEFDKALADYGEAIRINPYVLPPYFRRSVIFVEIKKEFNKAIDDLGQFLKLTPQDNPKRAEAYYYRALAWWAKRELDNALSDLSQAIKLTPGYLDAHYNRAGVWFDKRELDKAIDDLTEVLRLNPNHAQAYYMRARTWGAKSEFDLTITDLTSFIRLRPDRPEGYFRRGMAWREKKEFDKAVADFGEALKLDPNHAEAYLRRGFILWRVKKEPDKAIADFSEVIKFRPGEALAFYYRGWVWKDKKEFDKAAPDLTEAAKLFPEKDRLYGHAHFLRATVYLIQGKWTEALAGLEKAVWAKDLHPYYSALIPGLVRERVGDLEGARRIWKERRERPGAAWPWPLVELFLGEKSEAEVFALIEKSPEKDRGGQRCEAYFYLGFHALSRGNRQLARGYYQRCLNEAQADPTVKTYFEFDMSEAELRRMK